MLWGKSNKVVDKRGEKSYVIHGEKMEVIEKESLFNELRPYLKEMIEEIMVESFRRGEMRELLEDLLLAKAMTATEIEVNLSHVEALKQIKWK